MTTPQHKAFFSNAALAITADGSTTLVLKDLNEQYHSLNGAIRESSLVYIQNGLNYFNKNNLNILEIGFGTGLNCLLTYASNVAHSTSKTIHYTALEPFPVAPELVEQLNYTDLIKPACVQQFKAFHQYQQIENNEIDPTFFLTKSTQTVQEFQIQSANVDLIYFDAFAPAIQPEMWTSAVFNKLFSLLNPGGILVTYCAKGEVKRNLKSAGFIVESLPGPPGKREITRAIKQ